MKAERQPHKETQSKYQMQHPELTEQIMEGLLREVE